MLFKNDAKARAQHQAVRENAGWYRWTHDLVKVTGKDSTAFLDWLFVNTVGKAAVGRSKYTTMLNEDGRIIDDTIVMHMGEDTWWVSTLYAPQFIKWADAHKGSYDVAYEDITKTMDCTPSRVPTPARCSTPFWPSRWTSSSASRWPTIRSAASPCRSTAAASPGKTAMRSTARQRIPPPWKRPSGRRRQNSMPRS